MIAVAYMADDVPDLYDNGVTLPAHVEGLYGLCNECAAVVRADTFAELDALHMGAEPCPKCGVREVCAGRCCIRRAEAA